MDLALRTAYTRVLWKNLNPVSEEPLLSCSLPCLHPPQTVSIRELGPFRHGCVSRWEKSNLISYAGAVSKAARYELRRQTLLRPQYAS